VEGLGINLGYLIAQLVNFLLLVWLLNRFAYKPVLRMLAERRQRIEDGLRAADLAREEAARQHAELERQLEEERRKARERIADAARQSEQMREQILAEARAEAERIVAEAREQAVQERERILQEAQRQIADLSLLVAQKVVGETLDERRHHQLIQKFLASEL